MSTDRDRWAPLALTLSILIKSDALKVRLIKLQKRNIMTLSGFHTAVYIHEEVYGRFVLYKLKEGNAV